MQKTLFWIAALLGVSTALQSPHDRAKYFKPQKKSIPNPEVFKRASSNHGRKLHSNNKTAQFEVDGTGIPDVNFDIGESYAGTLSISDNSTDENQLFFWFFPSSNVNASDEIVIWLNGGPGCSSMLGLLQENGPFLWQPGTYRPYANPYSWVNLTNMVWIDQPIGTGFSPYAKGSPAKLKNEVEIAQDFIGFWKNFMETFDLTGRKVYFTGESYAGQYIPYMAYEMLMANNTQYYNVKGIQINDPSINTDQVMTTAPAVGFVNNLSALFGLNQTTMDWLNEANDRCGYTEFMEKSLVYPPTGKLPNAPPLNDESCNTWAWAVDAAIRINPCFNFYHITDFCPYLWDVFGFPSLGWGPNNYFNRTDVQKAINAPPTNYISCGDNNLGIDYDGDSLPSALGPLPHVIEMTNNVLIGAGQFDFLLLTNGTLVTIQNMTWNGAQGFQTKPSDNLYVPYHPGMQQIINDIQIQTFPGPVVTDFAGAGYLGVTHSERGLTFAEVYHSGHEIPQYIPGAAFRMLEFLLGRISSLTEISDYSTQKGNYTGVGNYSGNPY